MDKGQIWCFLVDLLKSRNSADLVYGEHDDLAVFVYDYLIELKKQIYSK